MWTNYKRLFNGINVNTIICVVHKSHYEALNIQKTATHKEIKDAYYRLSMIYHPDKNKGSEDAAKHFRDITSAYEILGNVRQRRLYDSGVNQTKINAQYTSKKPFETMNTASEVYKSNTRSREYNFDSWSRAHYTNAFQKHYGNREILSQRKKNMEQVNQQHTYNVFIIIVTTSIAILYFMFGYLSNFIVFKQRKINPFFNNEPSKTKD
ncbi:DnaJ domain,DnaJ domain, conserved site [Cinara cedri]|uniref:DnaJ domain,DnaJ domain, conserved site n=1 Tax=Cinara cedri TaxID=506608 RepID=A0A5E4NB81_9HEMI|nr:DnaJ domain,DnaJ domain, conserved site [Cinara cedri]